MKHLISSKTIRILTILEEVYCNPRVYIDDLAVINMCSKNTARADLDYIYEHWQDTLKMTVDHQAVLIENRAMGDLMQIKESLLRGEIALRLLINIFIKPHYSICDHSLELNYSESHLRKTISKINEFLSEMDASIEYLKDEAESKPVIVAKNEITICHLLANLYTIGNFQLTLPLEKADSISVFETYLVKLNLPITLSMRTYLDVLSQITRERYRQGFYTREDLKRDYEVLYGSFEISDFIDVFRSNMQTDLMAYFSKTYLEQHQTDFKMVNDVVIALLFKIIASSRNVDDVLNRYRIFHKRYSVEYPKGFETFNESLDKYSTLIGKPFKEYYAEIIYNLYIHVPNIRPTPGYRLGVYSDLGVSHAYTLVQFVQRHFPGHIVSVYDEKESYDLVFSTVSNNKGIKEPVILIGDLPGSVDIHNIYMGIYYKYRDTDLSH